MGELVTEQVEKEQTDSEWRKFHERGNGNGRQEPTAQQKSYLNFLAKAAGVEVDVSKLKDRNQASRLIDSLKNARSSGRGTAALGWRSSLIPYCRKSALNG